MYEVFERKLINYICNNVLNEDYQIIVLTETWLTDGFADNEFIDERYSLYRRDRCSETRFKSRERGILIAVLKDLNSCRVLIDILQREDLWVSIMLNNASLVLCATYIPPNSSQEVYSAHCFDLEFVSSEYSNSVTCVPGDSNLSNVSWLSNNDSNGFIPICSSNIRDEIVRDSYMFCGCNQYNANPNSTASILDLIFSNCDNTATVQSSLLITFLQMWRLSYCLQPMVLRVMLMFNHLKIPICYLQITHSTFVILNSWRYHIYM